MKIWQAEALVYKYRNSGNRIQCFHVDEVYVGEGDKVVSHEYNRK
jgi:hypothetical protein